MKQVDLRIYKDKINKLHKAALEFKDKHDEYSQFQNDKLLTDDFDINEDWKKLTDYMVLNPDLDDKLNEIEKIIDNLND